MIFFTNNCDRRESYRNYFDLIVGYLLDIIKMKKYFLKFIFRNENFSNLYDKI